MTTEIDQTLSASSLCEAFQQTAPLQPDNVALRAVGGGMEITWSDYARRVEDIAAGLAALGVGRGDTVGLMMVNRPEFHLVDTAALHLGATPFSIYNTSAPEQIEYLFGNAANRVVVCEEQFVDRVRGACPDSVEDLICVDGCTPGTQSLTELEAEPHDGRLAGCGRFGPGDHAGESAPCRARKGWARSRS